MILLLRVLLDHLHSSNPMSRSCPQILRHMTGSIEQRSRLAAVSLHSPSYVLCYLFALTSAWKTLLQISVAAFHEWLSSPATHIQGCLATVLHMIVGMFLYTTFVPSGTDLGGISVSRCNLPAFVCFRCIFASSMCLNLNLMDDPRRFQNCQR